MTIRKLIKMEELTGEDREKPIGKVDIEVLAELDTLLMGYEGGQNKIPILSCARYLRRVDGPL